MWRVSLADVPPVKLVFYVTWMMPVLLNPVMSMPLVTQVRPMEVTRVLARQGTKESIVPKILMNVLKVGNFFLIY